MTQHMTQGNDTFVSGEVKQNNMQTKTITSL